MSNVIIELKRTSSDLSTLTNVLEYGEPAYSTTSKALVVGDGTTQIKSLPRFLAMEQNISETLVLKGGGTSAYPSFSALVANDIPNLSASKIKSGTLPISRGGTGKTSTVIGGVAYGGNSTLQYTAVGTAGQVLSSNGTSAPTWIDASALSAGRATQDSNGNNIIATYETKSQVSGKGNATTPVYFDNAGNAQPLTYTIAKSVPANAVFTDTKYSAGTGISLSGTTFSNSGVRSIKTGTSNGTISVNTNGTSSDVPVKGLGTAAYASANSFLGASATAVSATKLATARLLKVDLTNSNGSSFNGTADVSNIGVSGVLRVANGGTNKSSWTPGRLVYANTASSLTEFDSGLSGQILMSNGSGNAPQWNNLSSLNPVTDEKSFFHTSISTSSYINTTCFLDKFVVCQFQFSISDYSLYTYYTLPNAEVKQDLKSYSRTDMLPYYIIVLYKQIPQDCRPTDVIRVFNVTCIASQSPTSIDQAQAIITPSGSFYLNLQTINQYSSVLRQIYGCGVYTKTLAIS